MDELDTEIGKHLIQHCLESGNVSDHTHEDASWSYTGWTVERLYSDDSGNVFVEATQEDSIAERVSRSTRNHPAEYERHDIEIHLVAVIDFSDDYLAGDTEVTIEDTSGHTVGRAYNRSEY